MKHRYEEIYDELLEVVPELRPQLEAELEEPNEWERELKRSGQEYSEADLEYLRQQIPPELQPKKPEPLLYIIFEDQLRPLLVSYSQHSRHFARLAEIMNWLEELARDGDQNTRNLIAIAICEGFIGNHSAALPQLLPFMGETMRQMCRDFVPFFRLNEESRALLLAPTKNARRFAKRP